MTRRKEVPHVPQCDRNHIIEDESRAGEVVRILPPPDAEEVQVLPGIYRIIRDCHNTRTGTSWVELHGGPHGISQFRAVRPERIRLANKGERKRAPKSIQEERAT